MNKWLIGLLSILALNFSVALAQPPQSEHKAATAEKLGKWTGQEEFAIFKKDGSRVVALIQHGNKQCLMVNGKIGPEYDKIHSPVFSPDGMRLAYATQKGEKCFVVVDGKEGLAFDLIAFSGPVFSPDGKHLAYTAQKGGKIFMVLDGRQGPAYEMIPGGPMFQPDGTLEYLAIKDGALFRVK
jgi:Tol biopolymer transport system component